MVGVLSNEGINALEKEGNPQPYMASMESVHHGNFTFEEIWPRKARTDHVSMLRNTTTKQCLRLPLSIHLCYATKSEKTKPQQWYIAFQCVNTKSGSFSNKGMQVCEKEGNYSPTLAQSMELQDKKAIFKMRRSCPNAMRY